MFSVIIPNYNHSRYLDQRIQSILKQTYKNFEIIILDDKSTDDSLSVINKYSDNQHVSHVIVNEINSGSTFSQWAKGIKLAKGEYIWIAESDDFCEPTMLEELAYLISNTENCTLAYTTSLKVDENGIPLESKDSGITRVFSGEEYVCSTFVLGNFVLNASSAIFKRDAVLRADESWKSFIGAGDTFLWVLVALQGNVAVLDKQLNYFRRHTGVVTDKRFRDGTNYHEELLILDYIRKHVASWTSIMDRLAVHHRCLNLILQLFTTPSCRDFIAEELNIDDIVKTWRTIDCLETRKFLTSVFIEEKRHLLKTGLIQYRKNYPNTLDYIRYISVFWFYFYFFKEINRVGLCYAIKDYNHACIANGANPNPFVYITAYIRVKIGALIRKII